jgi:hypothetical protein
MRAPSFMKLARIDGRRFITACRHGLVHVTWGRITLRFSQEEFRRLGGLLERAADALPPGSVRDGELRVVCRPDEECELRVGPLVLLLPPAEFQALVEAVREAVQRLDQILSSGMWDEDEADEAPPSVLEQLRRTIFSRN